MKNRKMYLTEAEAKAMNLPSTEQQIALHNAAIRQPEPKQITERIKSAATKVLVAQAGQIDETARKALAELQTACDAVSADWQTGKYTQIGYPDRRREIPLNAQDIASQLAKHNTCGLDQLSSNQFVDDVLYNAEEM